MRDRKTEQIVVRVTERERARIEEFATKHGLTTSKATRRLFEVGLVAANSEGNTGLILTPVGVALPIAHPIEV